MADAKGGIEAKATPGRTFTSTFGSSVHERAVDRRVSGEKGPLLWRPERSASHRHRPPGNGPLEHTIRDDRCAEKRFADFVDWRSSASSDGFGALRLA
jgi:hypothetical protein